MAWKSSLIYGNDVLNKLGNFTKVIICAFGGMTITLQKKKVAFFFSHCFRGWYKVSRLYYGL